MAKYLKRFIYNQNSTSLSNEITYLRAEHIAHPLIIRELVPFSFSVFFLDCKQYILLIILSFKPRVLSTSKDSFSLRSLLLPRFAQRAFYSE